MNSLVTLLKANVINDWGLNTFSKTVTDKKEKKKAFYSLFAMVGGAIAIAYVVTLYALLMAESLEKIGFLELIIIEGIIISSLITLFSSIYKAQGSLFSAKDYDLLMSLPIKSNTVFASKLINLLIMNWVFTVFAVIPTGVIYFIKIDNVSMLYFVILIISIIFIPLIPTVVAALTAIILAYFASKFKYKNLTTVLGTIVLFIAIMVGSFQIQKIVEYVFSNVTSIIEGIGKIYPPIEYLTKALVEVNFVELLKFIAISTIPFILFIFIFSKIFTLINQRLGENYKKANYKMTELKTSSTIKALVNKEIKGYFSTPVYVINTAIGMVIAAISAVGIFFVDKQIIETILQVPMYKDNLPMMILGVMIFSIGLSTTTSSSISLEGKNLWIIKSLPIVEKEIFLGKIILNLLITLPLSIIINILFFTGLKFSPTYLLWNLIISIIYCIFAAVIGLVVNLYFPKMEWTTPTAVVKQGTSTIITMLITFATIALPAGAYILFKITNITMFLGVILVLLVVMTVGAVMLLNKEGVKRFREL